MAKKVRNFMDTYNELFQDAASLTEKLGLEDIKISLDGKKLIAEWLMFELGPKIAEHFSREGFVRFLNAPQSSVRLHHLFRPIIDDLLNVKSVMTTGYVKVANDAKEVEEFGYIEPDAIESALKEKMVPEKIHTWITLPSGEIIDLAFMTIYASLYHEESLIGNIVAKDPAELTGGMVYAPQVLGEAFYEKCHFDFTIDYARFEKSEEDEASEA